LEQQAQLVFGTAAESMQMMSDLPPKVAILRASALQPRPTDADDIGALQYLGRAKAPGQATQSDFTKGAFHEASPVTRPWNEAHA